MKLHVAMVAIPLCVNSIIFAMKVPARFPQMNISAGEVSPGTWSTNVVMVLQKAKEMHHPALIVLAKRGCPHCHRLMAAMTNEMFVTWQKDRNLLMGIYHRMRPVIKISSSSQAVSQAQPTLVKTLMKEIADSGLTAPIVCVYWPKENGEEIKRIFSGTRGNMLGQKHERLEGELIRAVDSIVNLPVKEVPSTKQKENQEGITQ